MSALALVETYFSKNGAIGEFGHCEGCIFRQTSAAVVPLKPGIAVEREVEATLTACDVIHGDVDAYECPAIDELIREENQRNEDETLVANAMLRESER